MKARRLLSKATHAFKCRSKQIPSTEPLGRRSGVHGSDQLTGSSMDDGASCTKSSQHACESRVILQPQFVDCCPCFAEKLYFPVFCSEGQHRLPRQACSESQPTPGWYVGERKHADPTTSRIPPTNYIDRKRIRQQW